MLFCLVGCKDAAVPLQCDHERTAEHRQCALHGDAAELRQRAHLQHRRPAPKGQDAQRIRWYAIYRSTFYVIMGQKNQAVLPP